MPGIVYVGGAHIKSKSNPLPVNIQKFLDESPEGVIYFSLGTVVSGSKMPKDKLQIFLGNGELAIFSLMKNKAEVKSQFQHSFLFAQILFGSSSNV